MELELKGMCNVSVNQAPNNFAGKGNKIRGEYPAKFVENSQLFSRNFPTFRKKIAKKNHFIL